MSFSITAAGHVAEADLDKVRDIEQKIVDELKAVVDKYSDHFESASFQGTTVVSSIVPTAPAAQAPTGSNTPDPGAAVGSAAPISATEGSADPVGGAHAPTDEQNAAAGTVTDTGAAAPGSEANWDAPGSPQGTTPA